MVTLKGKFVALLSTSRGFAGEFVVLEYSLLVNLMVTSNHKQIIIIIIDTIKYNINR